MKNLNKEKDSVLILLSGGIDSTALINYYLSKNHHVMALHFQYGQGPAKSEALSVNRVCQYYKINNLTYNFGFPLNQRNGEYIGRNTLFIMAASSVMPKGFSKISLGIHSGVPYYDCSERFINDCQSIIDGYFAGTVVIETPFLNYNKSQIYEYCYNYSVPIDLTYSCEKSDVIPCGQCPSCLDRRLLSEYKRNM